MSACLSRFLLLTTCLAPACGDDGDSSASASATMGVTTAPGTTTGGSGPTSTSDMSQGTGSGGATTTTGGGEEPTTGGPVSASETGSTGTTTSGEIKLDVGAQVDFGVGDCDCGTASEFGYIWVANSPESTVSKIDTTTMQEVGRYLTRADGMGNPSRTSVSISGRAVAVANRHQGLVKIWANHEDCDPNKNGVPGLQTSSGKNDVLPWGQDDCVAWYTDFPNFTTQRPVAWAPGIFNEALCRWEHERVWTAGCGGGFSPGFGSGDPDVALVDGDTGEILQTVHLAGYGCNGFGPYGGAVDSKGNLWLTLNNGNLAFVDIETFEYQIHPKPANVASYGMTVDSLDRVWVTSYSQDVGVARYDPVTMTWSTITEIKQYQQSGIAQGADGRIWVAGTFTNMGNLQGVAGIDPETLQVTTYLKTTSQGKGVSVDGKGLVWRAGGSVASRVDPGTGTEDTYTGLNGAYTYSDMTGFGVANVTGCQPAG
ncbi:MAG TPA: hypothetical protein VIK91_20375 [Nannocystis sp.]